MNSIYLDHAATTPIAPEVQSHFFNLLTESVGNSSSSHSEGTRALALLNVARETVAEKLGAEASEIVFVSGGTEGNNWILQRVMQDAARALAEKGTKPHLITSSIEHSSITNVAQWLENTGVIEWTELAMEQDGRASLDKLAAAIRSNTALVSIGHGNNEIGTIQDLSAIGDLCRAHAVLFHADACQTFCHEAFDVAALPVDFMTLSGHKIRAPKGVGAVFIRKGIELTPLLFGGKQERGLRPGTTSVELASAFAEATKVWGENEIAATHAIRRYAIARLRETFAGELRVNGVEDGPSLGHVLSFTLASHPSKELHRELANANVQCSTGAACGTGKSDSSAVLLGVGYPKAEAHQIRISFSPNTDKASIDEFTDRLKTIVQGK